MTALFAHLLDRRRRPWWDARRRHRQAMDALARWGR